MGLDPGSGIWKKPIPDPGGSRGQKGSGSRIRIRNTVLQHAQYVCPISTYTLSFVIKNCQSTVFNSTTHFILR